MPSRPSTWCASAGHTPRSDIAHSAALTRAAAWSSSVMSPSILSTGPSSLSTDPAHSAIDSSSGASSSIQADTREVAKVAVFEAPVTHSVVQTKHFFAMVAACGSRTPRACRRRVCYFILMSGTSLQTLSSRMATNYMTFPIGLTCDILDSIRSLPASP